ncbi:hypothetical protein OC844_006176, partial [Tilletia horrida]
KKRMSAVEKGIDKRRNKCLKMDRQRQESDMTNAAFNSISSYALQLQKNSSMDEDAAFARSKAMYHDLMKSKAYTLDLSDDESAPRPSSDQEDS